MRDESGNSRVKGVDADLDLMFAAVKALRELASDPNTAQDSARVYDFSIRWGTLLHGRLERLAYYHGRGEFAPDDQERYQALCSALRDSLPLVERLGLALPSVALDDAAPRS
ncbi:MAG: hypothetical protein JO281_22540 [Pseudonocardiales bacterium]|nr:hypothetical protein [Pseudonocardiales bacterium]